MERNPPENERLVEPGNPPGIDPNHQFFGFQPLVFGGVIIGLNSYTPNFHRDYTGSGIPGCHLNRHLEEICREGESNGASVEAEGMEISQTHQCYVLMMLDLGNQSPPKIFLCFFKRIFRYCVKGLL